MSRVVLLTMFFLLQATMILASPGGKIVKEIFDTPLGKLGAVLLLIIFFPWIIRNKIRTRKSVNSTKKNLERLSQVNHELFDEINLKNRMTDIFTRVHKAWSEEDLDSCEEFMTNWYQQNQQTVYIDDWKARGMRNICNIKEIGSIKPIYLRLSNHQGFEGSRVMYLIEANMEDYLVSTKDSSIIEGKKGYNDVRTVWTIKIEDGKWKVDNIEQSEALFEYRKMDSKATDEAVNRILASNFN